MPKTPQTKQDFYARYIKGEFGNRPLTWLTGKDMWASGYRGLCTIRGMDVDSGESIRRFNVPAAEARTTKNPLNESPDDQRIVLQGEVGKFGEGWFAIMSTQAGQPNQAAVRDPASKRAHGTVAKQILRYYLYEDYDWLEHLVEDYPDSVVEFTTYDYRLGILGERTLFWEVRGY